jgi:uncharacterized membrane protein YecN with MAPEG domain
LDTGVAFIGVIEVVEAAVTAFAIPSMFIKTRPDHWLIYVTLTIVHAPRIIAYLILLLSKRSQNSRQGMYITWIVTLILNFAVDVVKVVMIYVSITNSSCWETDDRYCTAETFKNNGA